MMGFVYADYKDQRIQDPFHDLVCKSFDSLGQKYPKQIISLVDPGVDAVRLMRLLNECEFTFYWGHGETINDKAFIVGSRKEELVSIGNIRKDRSVQMYLDACSIGEILLSADFPSSLLVVPTQLVDYHTSINMGYTMIIGIFSLGLSFSEAYHYANEKSDILNIYRLVGNGISSTIDFSVNGCSEILSVFENLHDSWKNKPSGFS